MATIKDTVTTIVRSAHEPKNEFCPSTRRSRLSSSSRLLYSEIASPMDAPCIVRASKSLGTRYSQTIQMRRQVLAAAVSVAGFSWAMVLLLALVVAN